MKFGLSGCAGAFESGDPKKAASMAVVAEELGFESVWINEEHFGQRGRPRICMSPIILGTAMAAKTTKLRIGFSVLLLPMHNPLRVAEDVATMDVVSNGRVDFGVSRGGNARYAEAFAMETKDTAARFRESLAFILDCWTKPETTIRGKKYAVLPKPVQRPHPPVYVGTYTDQTARWAGRSGHLLIQHGIQSRRSIKGMLDSYESGGGKAGDVPVGRFFYVGRDDSSARRAVFSVACDLANFLHSIGMDRRGFLSERDLEPERFYNDVVIAGGPRTCVEKVRALRDEMGVDYVNCLAAFFGYLPAGAVMKSLRLLSREVMPALG